MKKTAFILLFLPSFAFAHSEKTGNNDLSSLNAGEINQRVVVISQYMGAAAPSITLDAKKAGSSIYKKSESAPSSNVMVSPDDKVFREHYKRFIEHQNKQQVIVIQQPSSFISLQDAMNNIDTVSNQMASCYHVYSSESSASETNEYSGTISCLKYVVSDMKKIESRNVQIEYENASSSDSFYYQEKYKNLMIKYQKLKTDFNSVFGDLK